MSDTITITDPYRVQHGDSLGAIAQRCGRTITELTNFNKIANPNQLKVGQVIYLSKETAFGVSVLFLDTLRYPIKNLAYRLQFDDQTIQGITDQMGAVMDKITTRNAQSQVEVWIRNADNQWQKITATVSGYGHKLITLVSGFVVFKDQTEPLPDGTPPKPITLPTAPPKSNGPQAPMPPRPTGDPSKNNPDLKHKKHTGPQGQSVVTVGVDLPQDLLNYFAHYDGNTISEKDWKDTAVILQCEIEVLKAIAKVESGGASAFWRLNRGDGAHIPALRFERHYFSRLTKRQYDKTYPDISWRYPSIRSDKALGNTNKHMSDGKIEVYDLYPNYSGAYLRLINAFRLDSNGALKSCSWGKFQIMGENYKLCGADSVEEFVTGMCTSEAKQVGYLAGFIQHKPCAWKDRHDHTLGKEASLWDAVKAKNWKAIAFNYNGENYGNYDKLLEHAYDSYKKESHA